MTPEQQARQQIDARLLASGWIVQDYRKMDFSAGRGVILREVPLKSGTCDYLLLVDRQPLGVVEAKKHGSHLSGVAEQSGHYAENLPDFLAATLAGRLPFLYESTGIETFLLYRRPYKKRLTEPMLKELEKKLRDNHAAWTEDRLWDAFAATAPAKVKGRSQAGRFADLVSLVRFALEQQPVLAPFADSVSLRFNEWLMDQAQAGVAFQPEQLAWLNLIRDHIATSLSIEPDDLELSPFNQRGGLGKAHQLFGNDLNRILDELNLTLVA